MDPEYKKRLLQDGASAAAELGISSEGWPPNGGVTGEHSTPYSILVSSDQRDSCRGLLCPYLLCASSMS